MFESMLRAVEGAVEGAVVGFDPASVPLGSAESTWLRLDRIERLISGAKLRLAARVEESGSWRRSGRRSAADHLSLLAGTTVGDARGMLEASKHLPGLPVIEGALAAGGLSGPQVRAVVEAAAAAPHSQSVLVEAAGQESVSELRERCGRVKAAADRDPEATYARLHASRALRRRSCADGAAELLYRSTPDEVAEVASVVQSFADQLFKEAHRAGQSEPAEAYLADGLLMMTRRLTSTSPIAAVAGEGADPVVGEPNLRVVPKEVIVRVDWDALVRGWPVGDEVCEIPGVGSLPVSVVKAMVDSGDAVLKAVVTRGVDVVNVAHLGRRPSAFQQTALRWLDLVCVEAGCGQRAHLEIDHTVPWATSRVTLLQRLEPRCRHHHRIKTRVDLVLIGACRDPVGPAG